MSSPRRVSRTDHHHALSLTEALAGFTGLYSARTQNRSCLRWYDIGACRWHHQLYSWPKSDGVAVGSFGSLPGPFPLFYTTPGTMRIGLHSVASIRRVWYRYVLHSFSPWSTSVRACSHLALDIPGGSRVRHDIKIRHRVKAGRGAGDRPSTGWGSRRRRRQCTCKEDKGEGSYYNEHAIGGEVCFHYVFSGIRNFRDSCRRLS